MSGVLVTPGVTFIADSFAGRTRVAAALFTAELITTGSGRPARYSDARSAGKSGRHVVDGCRPWECWMRARDLAEPFPTVSVDTDAVEAARRMAAEGRPGLIVCHRDGRPYTVLPGSQVL